ncbi:MAG: ComF family protein [Longimicrobiaceae bacterium]
MPGVLARVGEGLLELVFAPVCVACRRRLPAESARRLVCNLCWSRCRALPAPRCPRCYAPLPPGSAPAPLCSECDGLPAALRVVRSAFAMEGPARGVILALKYRGWEAVAVPLAARLARLPLPEDVAEEARVVVPVPSSPARRRERGYNQAELIARAFALRTGRSLDAGLLERPGATETQTGLHGGERRANVAGAFRVPARRWGDLEGRHLLLLDDVWTTGATATACAYALVGAGARMVSVLTVARALGGRGRVAR